MRDNGLVIPSEVEGSCHESFKVTPRDPSTVARDDGILRTTCGGAWALPSQTVSPKVA